ncbi:MAG: recombination protein RecR [Spirochaetales bacterium]|nr:recombination protein RecR [Spirochaetales bacterium]
MTALERLIENLAKLPGLGKKSASRIAYFLLRADNSYVQSLSRDLQDLKDRMKPCPVCGNYTEQIPCRICTDGHRDKRILCVVEEPKDLLSVEMTHQYNGLYHVLMGAISPIDGIGPENLRIDSLLKRVREGGFREVILATNPTVEGDTTAVYIAGLLKEIGVPVTRLALGLPVGGDLEYADRMTLARALEGRRRIE